MTKPLMHDKDTLQRLCFCGCSAGGTLEACTSYHSMAICLDEKSCKCSAWFKKGLRQALPSSLHLQMLDVRQIPSCVRTW